MTRKDIDLRTNAFLKLHPPHEYSWAGKVTLSLGYPHSGWIQMAITCTAYVQGVIVDVSAVFEPFPDMIRWLEDISTGNLPSEFIIDEEGYGKTFRAQPVNDEEFLLTISPMFWHPREGETEEPLFMYVVASKKQIVSEFLKRWDDFVENQYDRSHWQESVVDLRTLDVSILRKFVWEK